MSVAVLFPGQGEQHEGMFSALPAGTIDFVGIAAEVLDENANALDSAASLAGTRGTQLALLIAGSAWADAAKLAGLHVDFFAGHSLGMWTAAVAAGAIDFADAVHLVDVRSRTMALASPPDCGMIAIDGLSIRTVDTAATRLRREGKRVWLSNVNSPSQQTASGTHADLELLGEQLRAEGARRVTRLAVTVPAHTTLMQPAADAVAAALAVVTIRKPALPIAGNLTGQTIFSAAKLRAELVESITRGVQWSTAVAILEERGVDTWIQAVPGRALLPALQSDHLALAADTTSIQDITFRVASRRSAGGT
ncbi:ACP S-malonyltransferase [Cryobacterium sp. AP23]